MKYLFLYRESNNFDDILNDKNLKKIIYLKIRWKNHLKLGLEEDDKLLSYIELKYGESIKPKPYKDRTPVSGVDYDPKKPKIKLFGSSGSDDLEGQEIPE